MSLGRAPRAGPTIAALRRSRGGAGDPGATAAARPAAARAPTDDPGGLRSAAVFPRHAVATLALASWGGLAFLAGTMLASDPPTAAFDLELILVAGQRVADGLTPYAERMIDGTAGVNAVDLFYSYPPPVAQAASILAGLPLPAVLAGLWVAAITGWLLVVDRLARELTGRSGWLAVAVAFAIAPLVFPLAIGLLFGNVSSLYPVAYGLALAGLLAGERRGSRRWPVVGGVALGLVTLAKIHPGGLLLWLAARGWRRRVDGALAGPWLTGLTALVTMGAVGLASLALYGTSPWLDWIAVLRTASGVPLTFVTNVGPAAIVALVSSAGEPLVRPLHLGVVATALVVTVVAAWRMRETVASLAVAAAATLVLLPLTWLHYPTLLMPFVAAAVLATPPGSRRPVMLALAGALVAGTLSVTVPALAWIGIGLALALVLRHPGESTARSISGGVARPAVGPRV